MAGGCCGGVRDGYKRVYTHVAPGQPVRTTTDQALAMKWKADDGGRVEQRVMRADAPTTHG